MPPETVEEIEKDRTSGSIRRTGRRARRSTTPSRTFDSGAGKFTDDDDYDSSERPFVTEEGVAPPAPDEDDPQNT